MIYFDIIDVCDLRNELAKSLNRALLVARHVPTLIFKMYFGVAMYSQREVQISVNLKGFSYSFHQAECSTSF